MTNILCIFELEKVYFRLKIERKRFWKYFSYNSPSCLMLGRDIIDSILWFFNVKINNFERFCRRSARRHTENFYLNLCQKTGYESFTLFTEQSKYFCFKLLSLCMNIWKVRRCPWKKRETWEKKIRKIHPLATHECPHKILALSVQPFGRLCATCIWMSCFII